MGAMCADEKVGCQDSVVSYVFEENVKPQTMNSWAVDKAGSRGF